MKILWDKYETALLIELYIGITYYGFDKAKGITELSESLRKYAEQSGESIDEIFRNENGISMQLEKIQNIFNGNKSGLKNTSKLFVSMVQLYTTNREEFNNILLEAKSKIYKNGSYKDDFFSKMPADLSPTGKYLYKNAFIQIEKYYIKNKKIKKSIFEIHSLSSYVEIKQKILNDSKFKKHNRANWSMICYILEHLDKYLRESNIYIDFEGSKEPELLMNPQSISTDDEIKEEKYGPDCKALNDTLDYLETRYSVQLRYDRFTNPTERYSDDILYKVSNSKKDIIWVYHTKNSSSNYVSIETEPEYVDNISDYHKGFYKEMLRISHPCLKLFFTNYDDISQSLKKICDSIDLYFERNCEPKDELSPKNHTKEYSNPIANAFSIWLANSVGLASPTIRSYISALNSAENYAAENNINPCMIFTEDKSMAAQTINNLVADSDYLVSHKMYLSVFKKYMEYIGYEIDIPQKQEKPESYDDYLKEKHPYLFSKLYSVSKIYDEPQGHSLERIVKLAGGGASIDVFREFLNNISWATLVSPDTYSFALGAVPYNENSQHISTPVEPEKPKVVLPDFNKENYVLVLNRRFQNGITCDSIGFEKFRAGYFDFFDEEINLNDDELSLAISSCGLTYRGKIFAAEAVIDSATKDKLVAYLENAFAMGKQMIYYKAIYSDMEDDFICCFNLADEEMLREYLKYTFNGEYYFFKDYMSKDEDVKVDKTSEIRDYLLTMAKPVNYDTIYAGLSHIPQSEINQIIRFDKQFVLNAKNEWFHFDIFECDNSELEVVSDILNKEIEENGFAVWSLLFERIQEAVPTLVTNNPYLSSLGIRNCISLLISDNFDFNSNIISLKGKNLDVDAVYRLFCRNRSSFTATELYNFSTALDTVIYYDSVRMESVRVSEDLFVSRSSIHFDIEGVDRAIESYIAGDYAPIKEFDSFLVFPNVGYEWNIFLLESFLKMYSVRFNLINNGTALNNVAGAVVRKSSKINDFYTLCVDVLANCDCNLTKQDALNYLCDNNYVTRKSYSKIDSVINEARIIRNRKE